ncbi:hypothetical protein QDR25_12790 [Acinetobacter baumannii]|uniref:hypothetical protein n=1 Tax=Acinetobacter baumannii TaxID=470 RepID=UPI00233FCA7E|nr:hypothetical protein [Acinetobacter baumannii]MDC4785902.1 hypothetical protein [Acinetobacter baumannii]MDH2481931.1 hypothetical protein [Acinetobacter baumannii]MDH2503125.1 hypothetical protein [Acinetobacter baumannii]
MKFNFSIDIAVIVSLTAIFLFVLGQSYLGGFLSPFYIEPVVLNFSIQDKIYWGFVKGKTFLGFLFFIFGSFYIITYAFVYLVIYQPYSLFSKNRPKKLIYFFKNILNIYKLKNINYLTFLYGTIIFPLFVLASINLSAEQGEIDGRDLYNNIQKRPLVKITDSKSNIPQYRILCGSTLCAVIDEKKNISLVEPKSIIYPNQKFNKSN